MKVAQKDQRQGYLGWAFNTASNYARNSYSLSYVYGKLRGMAQPWISTDFNVQLVEEGVYIGDIASASNVKELKALGITHIVTAVLGVSPQFPGDFTYMNIPIMDVEKEDIKPYLNQAIRFIDDSLAKGGKVLVHCVRGASRSASIVAAWVMSKKGGSVEDTISLLRDKRECVNPNLGFRHQLEEYQIESQNA